MIDKNYFLKRLANGEDMDAIGDDIAVMMNEALAEHNAKRAEADRENAKRELVKQLAGTIQELAILEGLSAEDISITDEDIDVLLAGLSELFGIMRGLKEFADKLGLEAPAATPIPASDDEILADFLKFFS
ncbi:MAG: hypothetical protein J6R96_05200 [Spirochaetaceae bacterium]|nr:hypothetical protein [Spirochaetaceae bacterium]